MLRNDLYLGTVYVRIMQQSTEDITAPWLLPEMVSRVADMLNYFLDHLAGAKDVLVHSGSVPRSITGNRIRFLVGLEYHCGNGDIFPVLGYLNRSVLTSNRLCNVSLSCIPPEAAPPPLLPPISRQQTAGLTQQRAQSSAYTWREAATRRGIFLGARRRGRIPVQLLGGDAAGCPSGGACVSAQAPSLPPLQCSDALPPSPLVPRLSLCEAGPKRKQLRVRKPEKYHWKPQELLTQLARIYLNLGRADSGGDFVEAIAADKRSYHEGLFVEAAEARPTRC